MKKDFSYRTKLYLAKRSGEKCSMCKITTSKPKSGTEGYINIGEAAHIKGNRPGLNNRYDSSMTAQERMHISNAIWLCPTCHKNIDSDESFYSVEYLNKIKTEHELEVLNGMFDINYLPIVKELKGKITLLNIQINDKEKIIKKSGRLFSLELNSLKEQLYIIENQRKEIEVNSNKFITSLLNIDVDKDYDIYDKIYNEFNEGNLNNALKLLDEELLLKKEMSLARIRLIKANIYNLQNNFEKAYDNYNKAFVINSGYEFFHPYLVFLNKNCRYKDTIKICKIAILKENSLSTKAFIYGFMGITYREMDKLDLSIKFSLKGLKLLESVTEKESISYRLDKARHLNTIGITFQTNGELKKSLKAFEDCLNLYFQISLRYNKFYSDELVQLYNNIGNLYKQGNDIKGALDSFLYAYGILKKIKSFSLDRAILCINIRNCYFDRVYLNLKDAKKYILESIKLLNNIKENNTYKVLEIITIANMSYADILFIEKNYKTAEKKYLKALKYAELLYKINAIKFNRTLNSIYNNLSVFYFQTNNLELSIKYNDKSIELLDVSNLINLSNKMDLASTLMFKCNFLESNPSNRSKIAIKTIGLLKNSESNLKTIRLRNEAKKYL